MMNVPPDVFIIKAFFVGGKNVNQECPEHNGPFHKFLLTGWEEKKDFLKRTRAETLMWAARSAIH